MDIKLFQYFKVLCEEKTMRKAADKLYISQQGLSKAITSLEKELDFKLFHRTTKRLTLTKAGEAFYDHAVHMLSLHTGFLEKMTTYRDFSTITIHVMNGARLSLPNEFFSKLKAMCPDIQFNIQDLSNESCMNNLEQDMADFIIAIPFEEKQGICCHTIKKDGIQIIVPTDHPLSGKTELHLLELSGYPLVLYSDATSSSFLDYCENKGIHFSDVTFVHDILSVYQFCSSESKIGITLNGISGKIVYDNLIEVPLSTTDLTWNLKLMYKEYIKKSEVIADFIAKILSIT